MVPSVCEGEVYQSQLAKVLHLLLHLLHVEVVGQLNILFLDRYKKLSIINELTSNENRPFGGFLFHVERACEVLCVPKGRRRRSFPINGVFSFGLRSIV